jgi:hypothetical protein
MKMVMGVPSDAALLKDIQRLLGKETAEAIPGLELGGEETPDMQSFANLPDAQRATTGPVSS